MQDEDTPIDQDDQEEKLIKDPIYDIMGDEEAQVAFDNLMQLAEEKQAETPKDDESK